MAMRAQLRNVKKSGLMIEKIKTSASNTRSGAHLVSLSRSIYASPAKLLPRLGHGGGRE
jgi:hypothetical protein